MHARKKAMTGCGVGSSAQRRVHLDPSFPPLLRIAVRHGLANLLLHQSGGRIVPSAVSSTTGADKTLRPALGCQILPALLVAAKQRLEILNGKYVFSFQLPRCFTHGSIVSSFVRLTNIDIYYFFDGTKPLCIRKQATLAFFHALRSRKAVMLLRMCKLQTLEAVMSLKNKVVPFRFLSEPQGSVQQRSRIPLLMPTAVFARASLAYSQWPIGAPSKWHVWLWSAAAKLPPW
jgi:hypothetical protein